MKLVLVTETYPPEVNGVAMTLERLVRNLIKLGHDVELVRPKQKADSGSPSEPYPVHLVGAIPIPGYAGMQFGWFAGSMLKKLWTANRPDVVHIATEGPLGLSALNIARKLGIPVVTSFHTNFHSYGDHYNYKFLANTLLGYFRWFHNRTLATFVPSRDVVRDLEKFGFKNVKIFSRGVDTELFGKHRRQDALRQSWGAQNGDPIVVYVGRVAAEKNIPLTIAAYERLKKRLPAAKLVVVGDGPERVGLEKKHPEIIFAGMQRGEDLAAHYASADFFLFASTTETFGNVLTEAMASELVVLGYDYAAANHHVIDGENGFKVPFKDEAAFLSSVDRLLDDQANWPAIRQAARAKAESLSWASIIGDYASQVEQLAGLK
ncbi:glycosyltransferase family 4 protein [Cerasicoccus arenae]|uniref:Glycoside hydrolase n=1 Tax=Cerasicoccus arenae TaxID=424488 RepID=A0A8J3DAS1_9BACT|nr:glycosyltransferase family 1 protein [Cerasicoccus arenae]MBK1859045.1 glycosyltransferase family 1 protein [Cerasicoccus arenae]GHC03303.1 glycoside hydrolase [Cerasicoccus arenae]